MDASIRRSVNKEVRELIKEAVEMGWAVGLTVRKTVRLTHPEYEPVCVASTANYRLIHNARALLRRPIPRKTRD